MNEIVRVFGLRPLPKTDDVFKEYQEQLGEGYKLLDVEPPKEDGTYEHGNVGIFYYSLYACK